MNIKHFFKTYGAAILLLAFIIGLGVLAFLCPPKYSVFFFVLWLIQFVLWLVAQARCLEQRRAITEIVKYVNDLAEHNGRLIMTNKFFTDLFEKKDSAEASKDKTEEK